MISIEASSPEGSTVIGKIYFTTILLFVVLTSIILQHKFDFLYSIIYIENTYLHEESLKTQIQVTRLKESFEQPLYRLDISSIVHFSKTPSNEVNIFIPEEFAILGKQDFFYETESIPGYTGIRFTADERNYRNVSGKISLFIYPRSENIAEKPVIAIINKNGKTLNRTMPYALKNKNNRLSLAVMDANSVRK